MSSLTFLVTELQAAEKSLAILRSSPEYATAGLSPDSPHAGDLLRPVFMGCATKNAKVVAISLGSLQRLIAMRAVPLSAVPAIIETMTDAMSQGVDIQLRILQTLVSLITNYPSVHGVQLGDALLLCFKLQDSRIAVVSSTAAATLRQLVMFVVDKMVTEDRQEETPNSQIDTVLPDGTMRLLGPYARDTYSVFEDLCLLANSERPHFLKLDHLHKTFALELIESVLTNYHDLFRKRSELLLLLQHLLCPLLLKSLSDRHVFPLTLRCTRVVFLLLKQFSHELQTEAEVFLMLLIRMVGDESDGSDHPAQRPWVRVLAMEVIRGLCSDAELIRNIWDRYDALQPPPSQDPNTPTASSGASKVFASLLTTLKRLVTEKPAILGVSSQMFGIGVSSHSSENVSTSGSGGIYDVGGGIAGMVANAASATVSGVVGMIGSGGGLGVQGAAMKLQCIDQLDKADAPPIPEAYIYLLGVQCIVALCEGLASFTGPLYTAIMVQRPRSAGEPIVRAPGALDVDALPEDETISTNNGGGSGSNASTGNARQLRTVRAIVDNGWPALLAALSFVIVTNLSDELFVDVLTAYQALINVAGMLGLSTPRDALFTSLAKFALPAKVVASLDSYSSGAGGGGISAGAEPTTPRTATIADGFGFGSSQAHAPGLSERNLVCLKALVSSAMFLAGSLGESWYAILETLQNADYVLRARAAGPSTPGPQSRRASLMPSTPSKASMSLSPGEGPGQGQGQARHPLLADADAEGVQNAITRLFEASKNLEDGAFHDFTKALCKLSAEMVGMQSAASADSAGLGSAGVDEEALSPGGTLSPESAYAHRRRVSGIHLPKTSRSSDFGLERLGTIAMLNIHRLIYRSPDIAWNTTTTHLLSVLGHMGAPEALRLQAARILDEILVVVPRNISSNRELQADVQQRVLAVLAQQVILPASGGNRETGGFGGFVAGSGTANEIRKMGLETLHQILQASGHTLVVGWETIFEMLGSVCKPPTTGLVSSASAVSLSRTLSVDSVITLSLHAAEPSAGSSSGRKPPPSPLGYTSEKAYSTLVKIAFQSLKLVCDAIALLSADHLRLCISTLGQFGKQADTNIALTAAESLLWSVSDSIQAKRKDADKEREYSAIWMDLLVEVLGLCSDARAEVRNGSIQTLFRAMQLYGATLGDDTWDECVWKITFPLLDALSNETRRALETHDAPVSPPTPTLASGMATIPEDASSSDREREKAWDDSKALALQSIGAIMAEFLPAHLVRLGSFARAWQVFVRHVQDTVLLDRRSLSAPALLCLEQAVKALPRPSQSSSGSEGYPEETRKKVADAWLQAWEACDTVGGAVLQGGKMRSANAPLEEVLQAFSQESLVALVEVIRSTRVVSRALTREEWPLERLTRLMEILKGVLTYPNSPEYRPDIDGLTPSQSVVMNTIQDVDLSRSGSPSLVMHDLSEFCTLPFLAAFSIQADHSSTSSKASRRQMTYIGLAKKVMPYLVELFVRFKDDVEVYSDGTVEAILSAYSIPIKLKYECPAPSKFGKDPPLWKTATTCFLRIVTEAARRLSGFGDNLPPERIEAIWRQMIDIFRGGILADCSVAETFSLETQETEENFDLSLISSLEIDIVPHLGDAKVPDSVITQLAKVLHQGSQLYKDASLEERLSLPDSPMHERLNRSRNAIGAASSSSSPDSHEFEKVDLDGFGSTAFGALVPRERFSFWCFDLLFLICSDVTTEPGASRKRVAALCLPSLLDRCKSTMVGYVADEALRGNLPFPRAREDELLYVLRKLLETRLWPGTLWAALSDSPTENSASQPGVDASLPPSALVADVVRRSAVAHLFYFYPVLCEIASIPRKTPSTWVSLSSRNVPQMSATTNVTRIGDHSSPSDDDAISEVDARILAKQCLKVLGKEMGTG
ncbi:hypothetical protein CONPUDRAFT_146079 [Coniophora puteana RWD-64-598 SS2]|uniref:Protein MON2 homolog n=1 Tax=Coniophora puteana (strain RWD-64-598) TaxID=741705 RepID=A0A5M3MFI7_CONPW|nr:uncharacterized protein CONPUDRAFT_146079 [Coniophora puteana RWD-64-598 SS2]EIW78018.1 hypothetical protein CONPUDRAFT_146079 [Coniophora puteana RWD-64-598 SS2]